MDGGIAGTGPASLQDSLPRSEVAPGSRGATHYHVDAADLAEDEVAGSLLNLASPQISQLLERMEQARLTLDPILLDSLLQTAITAANSRDIPRALAAIAELVAIHPERGAQVVRDAAALGPIRGEVNELLNRLSTTAKVEAEHTLEAASSAIENRWRTGAAPQMLALAQRFLDTGQHINFVRAQELGQAVLAYFPEGTVTPAQRLRGKGGSRRRPLVLTILGWISLVVLVVIALGLVVLNRP